MHCQSQDLQPALDRLLDANTGMKPGDYLFIEFGINDATTTCEAERLGTSAPTFSRPTLPPWLRQPRIEARNHLSDVDERSAVFWQHGPAQPRIRARNQGSRGSRQRGGHRYDRDLGGSVHQPWALPEQRRDLGASGAFFCNDTTHFEKAGALQIAQAVAKALKDQGIGLGAYVVN